VERVPKGKNPLLGPGLFLVPAGAAEGGVKAVLVQGLERTRIVKYVATEPYLMAKVEKLESDIMELEEQLESHHRELIELSNSGESATLIELSKTVANEENQVEEMFEESESIQTKLDEINEDYEQKIKELS
jgi:uncharacterized protein YoxC